MTPAELREAGEALWGQRWQTEMAVALGLRDSSRIREMLRGARPVREGMRDEIIALLRQRGDAASALADRLTRD